MNQSAFGELFGVSNKTVSRWETGTYLPPVEILELMSREFGVTINEIIAGERMQPGEFEKRAEENLKSVLRCSAFTFKEKEEYFSKHWEKLHIALRILSALICLGIFIIGIYQKSALTVTFAAILTAAVSIILYNMKRSYVEKKTYLEDKNFKDE